MVVASGVLASVAPWGAPGLDYFTGMGQDNVDDIELYFADRDAARRKAGEQREELLSITADQLADSMRSLVSEAEPRC